MRTFVTSLLLALVVAGAPARQSPAVAASPALSAPDPEPSPAALIARATARAGYPYVAPPGDPLVPRQPVSPR
jgi:hypothetical protein